MSSGNNGCSISSVARARFVIVLRKTTLSLLAIARSVEKKIENIMQIGKARETENREQSNIICFPKVGFFGDSNGL
jgi:hypothetical protein